MELFDRLKEYAAVDYGIEAYPLSGKEAELILEVVEKLAVAEKDLAVADAERDGLFFRIKRLEAQIEAYKDKLLNHRHDPS